MIKAAGALLVTCALTGPVHAQSKFDIVKSVDECLSLTRTADAFCENMEDNARLRCRVRARLAQRDCFDSLAAQSQSRPQTSASEDAKQATAADHPEEPGLVTRGPLENGAAPNQSLPIAGSPPTSEPQGREAPSVRDQQKAGMVRDATAAIPGRDRGFEQSNTASRSDGQDEVSETGTAPDVAPPASLAHQDPGTQNRTLASPDGSSSGERQGPVQAKNFPSDGTWNVSETASPIDFSPLVIAELQALHRPVLGAPSAIVLRCYHHKTELSIRLSEHVASSSGATVDIAISGQLSPTRLRFKLSPDRKTATLAQDASELVRTIGGTTIQIGVFDKTGTNHSSTFDLAGIESVRRKFVRACGASDDVAGVARGGRR